MVANPELAESECTQGILPLFDHGERLPGHRTTVLDARRKTGRGRLVPDSQASRLGKLPDVLLVQAGCKQGCQDMVLLGCLLAGPEVGLVVSVHSVRDRVEAVLLAEGLQHSEQLVFAVEAAE